MLWGFTEKSDFQRRGVKGSRKINIQRGELPKRGGTRTVCIFQRGLGEKEEDSVFDNPMHTMCNIAIYADDTILYSKCDQASDLWQQLELATGL